MSEANAKPTSRAKLAEFYAVAKDNLSRLKAELKAEDKNYSEQRQIFKKLQLEYQELLKLKEKKDTEYKGAEEKKLAYTKYKNILEKQLKKLSEDLQVNKKDINAMRIAAEDRVKNVQNSEQNIDSLKRSQIETIESKIEKEQQKNQEILEKIKEVTKRIEEYKLSLSEMEISETNKGDALIKDTVEMNKFLSEI